MPNAVEGLRARRPGYLGRRPCPVQRPQVVGLQRRSSLSRGAAVRCLAKGAVTADAPPAQAPVSRGISERYRAFMDAWDKGFSFNHQECQDGVWLEVLEGALPPELCGTYFRNGPGRFSMGPDAYNHPYDGDGLIASVAIRDGRAFFRSAYIRTAEYLLEMEAQRVLFRGSFATQRRGGQLTNMLDLYIKNTSNTGVALWNGKLLTMFEAAQPYALDPATLATLGPELLDGSLSFGLPVQAPAVRVPPDTDVDVSAYFSSFQRLLGANAKLPEAYTRLGGDACTAHPHVDANTGRLCTWSYKVLLPQSDTKITFLEFDAGSSASSSAASAPAPAMVEEKASVSHERDVSQAGADTAASSTSGSNGSSSSGPSGWAGVRHSKDYVIRGYGFIHDIAVTRNYYLVVQPPVRTDMQGYVLGKTCAASSIRWQPGKPSVIHVVPRPGSEAERRGEQAVRIPIPGPPAFVFHHCNAYEDPARPGVIVMDSVHYDSLPAVGREALTQQQVDPEAGFRACLRRLEVDLPGRSVSYRNSPFSAYLEQPCIHPNHFGKKHRYIYGYSSIFEDASVGIAKIDMDMPQGQRWNPGKRGYICLEPRFVPRGSAPAASSTKPGAAAAPGVPRGPKSEDDGWLICLGLDTQAMRSEVLVFDAWQLMSGPVARLAVPYTLPHQLHGAWTHQYFGPSLQ